jgi:hypothetical protein
MLAVLDRGRWVVDQMRVLVPSSSMATASMPRASSVAAAK